MHGAYQSACRATLEFLKIFEETIISEKSNDEKWNSNFKKQINLKWNSFEKFSQIDYLK